MQGNFLTQFKKNVCFMGDFMKESEDIRNLSFCDYLF